ncbi:cupin domain-containing protein [Thalassotalea litorea]|uniref:Cupin domain-containing protein n=1 Tax=Thalassotalea litorea TaxID=2020715 RepID=A0A5R9IJ51_9GAMM|nr:cupin domain-containing protein [Thalassotalea litorea]TLU65322.1 cupin domain-containing protein [Thalassotalea litorea]
MTPSSLLFAFTISWLVCGQAFAQQLLRTSTSWDGKGFSYPQGKAELTSVKLRLESGQQTPFHCHPVPTFGYVLSGQILVETADGNSTMMKAGESAVEVMRTLHRGTAIDGPAEIVVFYAGAQGIPTTLTAGKDEHQDCKKYIGR